MFVDASVIVAIVNEEPDWRTQLDRLGKADSLRVSPLVRYESMVAVARAIAEKRKTRVTADILTDAETLIDGFFDQIGAEEISVTSEIGVGAIAAAKRYGKAVGHPADLNFGDCFAYACTKALKADLLYKGNDFALTDLA